MVRVGGRKMMNQNKILIFYLGFAFVLMGSVSAAQIWELSYDIENDPDIDHLTTSEELELGTDPNNRDTDGDGLEDEYFKYVKKPIGA